MTKRGPSAGGVACLESSGRVVDFLQLRADPLQTGIFNLADVAILPGGLLVLGGRLAPPNRPAGCDNPLDP
jgi:hypothetical protein